MDIDEANKLTQLLNERQMFDDTPLTCRIKHPRAYIKYGHLGSILIASPVGWICPTCGATYEIEVDPKPFPLSEALALKAKRLSDAYFHIYENKYKHRHEDHNIFITFYALDVMLACLHRYALAAAGIEVRPGFVKSFDSSWHSAYQSLPDESGVYELACIMSPKKPAATEISERLQLLLGKFNLANTGGASGFDVHQLGIHVILWRSPVVSRMFGSA